MFYPCAVLFVAVAIMGFLMFFVLPRFQQIFEELMNGARLPAFTLFVFGISKLVRTHFLAVAGAVAAGLTLFTAAVRTAWGRLAFDRLKLGLPILGPLFRKISISRFARTLGTLISNGVPILQALSIVKETVGNVCVGRLIETVHERVKQGDPISPTLKDSPVFPANGSRHDRCRRADRRLPQMLMKIADTYDEEVDNAATAMTSLIEPIMIVLLAVIVGSIVIAMFLPLLAVCERRGHRHREGQLARRSASKQPEHPLDSPPEIRRRGAEHFMARLSPIQLHQDPDAVGAAAVGPNRINAISVTHHHLQGVGPVKHSAPRPLCQLPGCSSPGRYSTPAVAPVRFRFHRCFRSSGSR